MAGREFEIMKIRKATIKDLSAIQDLGLGLFRDPSGATEKHADHKWARDERGEKYYAAHIKDPNKLCLVAETDGEVVGYLTGEPNPPVDWRPITTYELESFFVKPEYRSQGAGAEMVKQFAQWAKGNGAVTVRVSAYSANKRGIEFYKKVGFVPESQTLEKEL